MSVNIAVIAVDRVAARGQFPLTVKRKSVESSILPQIRQRRHDLKRGSGRIQSLERAVHQAAVFGIIYNLIPLLRQSIRIKIRFTHTREDLPRVRLHHYNGAVRLKGVIRDLLQVRVQRCDQIVSFVLLFPELIGYLLHRIRVRCQKRIVFRGLQSALAARHVAHHMGKHLPHGVHSRLITLFIRIRPCQHRSVIRENLTSDNALLVGVLAAIVRTVDNVVLQLNVKIYHISDQRQEDTHEKIRHNNILFTS